LNQEKLKAGKEELRSKTYPGELKIKKNGEFLAKLRLSR